MSFTVDGLISSPAVRAAATNITALALSSAALLFGSNEGAQAQGYGYQPPCTMPTKTYGNYDHMIPGRTPPCVAVVPVVPAYPDPNVYGGGYPMQQQPYGQPPVYVQPVPVPQNQGMQFNLNIGGKGGAGLQIHTPYAPTINLQNHRPRQQPHHTPHGRGW